MRIFFLFSFLIFLVACGKTSTSSHDVASGCAGSSCESTVQHQTSNTDKPAVLMDVGVDVGIKTTENEIVFLRDATDAQDGDNNASCNITVKAGDRYQYVASGDTLDVRLADGTKMLFKRMSFTNESLVGSWAWKGYVGDMYKIVQYSFINTGRLIIKSHCEL
jgi:hypothetical protein